MNALHFQCCERISCLRQYILLQASNVFSENDIELRKEAGNQYSLIIPMFEDYQLSIYVFWKTGQFRIQWRHGNGQFYLLGSESSELPTAHTRLLAVEDFEVSLNQNVSKVIDIITDLKRNIIMYSYFRAASLHSLEAYDARFLNQLKVQFNVEDEQKALLTSNCVYIRFPNFKTVYMAVCANFAGGNLPFLHRQFRPELFLLLEWYVHSCFTNINIFKIVVVPRSNSCIQQNFQKKYTYPCSNPINSSNKKKWKMILTIDLQSVSSHLL